MSVRTHKPTAKRRLASALCTVVWMILLVAQQLLPNLASAEQGNWIEICSGEGAVWVEVQSETTEGEKDCPDCATCAFCNLVTPEAPFAPQSAALSTSMFSEVKSETRQCFATNPAQDWPDNRGPPATPKNITVRAAGAFMALTRSKGVAPWS